MWFNNLKWLFSKCWKALENRPKMPTKQFCSFFIVLFQVFCCSKAFSVPLHSIGRCPPQITDASWRLQYHVKVHIASFGALLLRNFLLQTKMLCPLQNGQVDKVNEPFYLISLNTEVRLQHMFMPPLSRIFMDVFGAFLCVKRRFVPFVRTKDPRRISTLPAQWSSYRSEEGSFFVFIYCYFIFSSCVIFIPELDRFAVVSLQLLRITFSLLMNKWLLKGSPLQTGQLPKKIDVLNCILSMRLTWYIFCLHMKLIFRAAAKH